MLRIVAKRNQAEVKETIMNTTLLNNIMKEEHIYNNYINNINNIMIETCKLQLSKSIVINQCLNYPFIFFENNNYNIY